MTKTYINLILVLIVSSVFTVSCGTSSAPAPRHVFLLQRVNSARVVKAPDLNQYKNKYKLRNIIKNQSGDAGLPDSPLIKKMKILTDTRNCLFAPADSVYDFPVTVAENARLKFGFAITDMYLKYRRVPVAFRIRVKEKNRESFRLLFEEMLFPGSTAMQGWHDRSVDLNNSEGEIILRFETARTAGPTRLGDDMFAYWSNPYIINHQDNTGDAPGKKKLILISLDTLRADHLESYGYSRRTMPVLPRLSEDFVTFKNCWSQWCWTRESHHSIMTGLYEVSHQVPELYPTTPQHLVTLAEVMKSQGYITAAFTGSGHVGAHTGLCKGFDSYFDNEYRKRGGYELLGSWYRAKKWLKDNASNDFFLFFHTYEIHAPYPTSVLEYDSLYQKNKDKTKGDFAVRAKLVGRGLDRVDFFLREGGEKVTAADKDIIQGNIDYYDGSIRYTNDYFLKDLIAQLKTLGIYDDTVIVLLSDHGEEFFEHGRFKHFDGLYEEFIHVPLMFKLADSRHGGRVIQRNVETIDVFPTILDLMDIPLKHKIDGRSLFKWMDRKNRLKSRKHYAFSQSGAKFAVKHGKTKLLMRARVDNKTRDAVNRLEIYDLNSDPKEQNPVKIDDLSQHPRLYSALYRRLIRRERGIHLVFPKGLEGKVVEGRIDISGDKELKNIYEIGAVRGDFTRVRLQNRQIVFKWTISKWNKSLILKPRKGKLGIALNLKIGGIQYDLNKIALDSSLDRQGDIIRLTRKTLESARPLPQDRVFMFGNGMARKTENKSYFPDISRENLEKLKELGYIND